MTPEKKVQLDRKFTLLFETAKRSLLAMNMSATQIKLDLIQLEPDLRAGINLGERASSPLLSAVAFIDFAHRFSSVADALPFMRKDSPEAQRLKVAMDEVETARNHLQHMRGDLSSNEIIDYPILGSLCWVNGMTMYSLYFSQAETTTVASIAYDTHKNKWSCEIQYTVKHVALDIYEILNAAQEYYDHVCAAIKSSDSALMELRWGQTYGFATEWKITSIEVQPTLPSNQ